MITMYKAGKTSVYACNIGNLCALLRAISIPLSLLVDTAIFEHPRVALEWIRLTSSEITPACLSATYYYPGSELVKAIPARRFLRSSPTIAEGTYAIPLWH